MANDNVGHVKCPMTGDYAVVRKDCRGKLYYYSQAGKIAPNLPQGQEWLASHCVHWDSPNNPPLGVTVTTVVNGAPLTVTVGNLLPVNEAARPNALINPVNEPSRPLATEKPIKKKQSALGFLFSGGDE